MDLDSHSPASDYRNSSIITFEDDDDPLAGYLRTISPEMRRFAKRQYRNAVNFPTRDDRRANERFPILVPVLAIPIDENGKATDAPFDMLTRDVSEVAIGLIHADKFGAKELAIQFETNGEMIRHRMTRIWQDLMGPYYGSALAFGDEIDYMPEYLCEAEPSVG